MTKRIAPILIGLLVFSTRMAIPTPSDFLWPHCAARLLLFGADPYGHACLLTRPDGAPWVVNPLPTVIALLPLAWTSIAVASACVLGISSAFMAYGLVKNGDPARLMVFLSVPFLHAWYYGQWSPMMLGVALVPSLLPLILIKPHIGIPAFLTRLTSRRMLGVALAGLVSLLIVPSWPISWLALAGTYDGYVPLLTLPGLAVLLLLPRWRNPDARYLLACACVPQRGAYDPLIVALVLKSRVDVLVWVVSGWLITYLGWRYLPISADWTVVLATYVPAALLCFFHEDRLSSLLVSAPAEGLRSPARRQ